MSLYETYPVSLTNTFSRTKERFTPLHPPHVGLYVCGPTVYGPPHLGHGRSALTFDLVFRYLRHTGYQVRYVRNITDVGHLEDEVAGAGEDRIAKQARLAKLEPMEIVQIYSLAYHEALRRLNALPPSIEPQASGHVMEQIEFVRRIMTGGYAYETNGSVYFDLAKYARKHRYGELSGKVLDDLLSGTRDTAGLDEKRSPFDFALWKRAEPEHLMRWPSPWGEGFPGWHIECSVMSTKYLGETFDIHGAGMDLEFPHHEAEIAQSTAALGHASVRYWMHNNMITIGGQKMAKSLGNYITLDQLFTGNHPMLEQAYSPMTMRFFVLQSHYRSPVDFSNEPLKAAEKGYRRLMNALAAARALAPGAPQAGPAEPATPADRELTALVEAAYRELSDDFNTPQALATLFDLGSRLNALREGQASASAVSRPVLAAVCAAFAALVTDVLGLVEEREGADKLEAVVRILIDLRNEARGRRDFAAADGIRDRLRAAGVQLHDGKDGTGFSLD